MNDKQKTQAVSGFEQFLVDHGFLTAQAFDLLQKAKPQDSGKTVLSPGDIAAILRQEKLLDEEDIAKIDKMTAPPA